MSEMSNVKKDTFRIVLKPVIPDTPCVTQKRDSKENM
jgi:hypothetical protein